MSTLTHLQTIADAVKIPDWERKAIDISIGNLSYKLGSHFNNIDTKFIFGSYDRKTILRRSKDPNSDVDFMVVFTDGGNWTPQTLMNRLKSFAVAKYSNNEIYQSSPTVVLELGHIKFELAPAKKDWMGLHIPAPTSNYENWISTYPQTVKNDLNAKNQNCHYQIRKLVRLLKYWNVLNGKVYSSYELEKYVIDKQFWFCTNLKDYFYAAVEGLSTYNLSIFKSAKVDALKQIIANTKYYERENMPASAEAELKKVIP